MTTQLLDAVDIPSFDVGDPVNSESYNQRYAIIMAAFQAIAEAAVLATQVEFAGQSPASANAFISQSLLAGLLTDDYDVGTGSGGSLKIASAASVDSVRAMLLQAVADAASNAADNLTLGLEGKSNNGHGHSFSDLGDGATAVKSAVREIRIPAAFAADGSWIHKPVASWSVVKNATGDYTLSFGTSYSSYLIPMSCVTVAAWVRQESKTATGLNIKTYRDADSGGTGDILSYDADVFFEVILL